MNPDEVLKKARAALASVRANESDSDTPSDSSAAGHLADAFEALDGWLSKDGVRPADWRKADTLVVDHETAVIDAVRAWAAAECGATEGEAVLAALAAFDDASAGSKVGAHVTVVIDGAAERHAATCSRVVACQVIDRTLVRVTLPKCDCSGAPR
jgi:hypothetical protein